MVGKQAPRVEIIGLSKTYHRAGGVAVTPVNDVTLTVERDETVVLLGPSGCGKTTLLRCVAGLEQPSEGEIVLDGKLVFSARRKLFVPPNERRLSMVFQSYALWPHMSVMENVLFPLKCAGVARAQAEARAKAVLDVVGVGQLAGQYPGRLSGGQQQRVSLARALVGGAGMVLFDEPLSNVDALVRSQLRAELKRMRRQLGFSALYVTHDQAEALDLGHRIAVLGEGRVLALGSPSEVYNRPPSEYVANFLGAANIWDGVVKNADSSIAYVATAMGDFAVGCHGRQVRAAEHVKIVLRPERLTVSRARTSNGNSFAGSIVGAQFAGSYVEYTAACNAVGARAVRQASDSIIFDEGSDVWLSFDSVDAFLLPATAA